jgi:quinoprotein glucose dehydrogenase
MYAVDAVNGTLIKDFGEEGKVDLRWGLGKDPELMFAISNTPGVVYKDLLIQGTRVHEGPGASPGHIRAYNLMTGKIVWTFHTIPQEDEFGTETWKEEAWRYMGGANSWAGMSLDKEEGIVYIPTGSAAFDFYGGNRKGKNLFANSLVALNAATGERIWHFQVVHHDLWDRDLPAPPNLVTIRKGLKSIKAVAQVTKSGHVFIFDRLTGEPIYPIEELPFPDSDLEGEEAWPTQPIPVKPPPFARQVFTEDMINDLFPDSKAKVADLITSKDLGGAQSISEQFKMHKSGGQFVPVSVEGNIFLPGFDGGAEWGGAGYDPESGWLYVNANEMPWIYSVRKLEDIEGNSLLSFGRNLYSQLCARCHGTGLKGQQESNIPSLENVGERLSRDSIKHQMFYGAGQMLPFSNLSDSEVEAIVSYLLNDSTTTIEMDDLTRDNPVYVPYTLSSFGRFLDDKGYPAIEPPWGTLNAIDLNKGEIVWQVPLGEFEELTEKGISVTGTENYGGPVITSGGLVFIGATKDEKFRAFDKGSGKLIWQTDLPTGGYATPITYEHDGRQFIVIACGGGKMGTASGDAYVAFALPN